MTNVASMKDYGSHQEIGNAVKEPASIYKLENRYDRMVSLLGGSRMVGQVVNSDVDLVSLSRHGLPKSTASNLSEVLGLSMEQFSKLLHVSLRTLQRKDDKELLSVYSTEQLLEIASLVSRGIEVFATLENFKSWLHSSPYILNGQRPVDFLDTRFGIHYLKDLMGRIEQGIPS